MPDSNSTIENGDNVIIIAKANMGIGKIEDIFE